jgi:hypothetical protein
VFVRWIETGQRSVSYPLVEQRKNHGGNFPSIRQAKDPQQVFSRELSCHGNQKFLRVICRNHARFASRAPTGAM